MNNRKFLTVIVILLTAVSILEAQEKQAHRFTAEISGGSSVTAISVYEEDDMNIVGFAGSLRLLWEPEKLLKIGLEGGVVHLAHSKEDLVNTDFGPTIRANTMNAYPLMIIFNMKLWKAELMMGLGAANVTSKINAFRDISLSNVITASHMYGVGYNLPVSGRLSLGGEIKFYSFSTPEVLVGTAQLKLKYSIYEW
ncbi:MAG: hypothetical protein ACM3Q2_18525 [Syntrophothermus sp.]